MTYHNKLKNMAREWLLITIARLMGRRRDVNQSRRRIPSALICPSAPPGSIGDAAMIFALTDELRMRGYSSVGIIEFEEKNQWFEKYAFDQPVVMPERSIKSWCDFGRTLRGYDQLFVIGADCIDGYYSPSLSRRLLEIAAFATEAGCEGIVCGSSFNVAPSELVVKTMGKLPSRMKIFARDPRSFARIETICAATVRQAADLAFLLKPSSESIPVTSSWVTSERAANRLLLGLNIASAFLGAKRKGEIPELIKRFAEAIGFLLESRPDVSIILVPHDVRGENSDLRLCRAVMAKVATRERIHLFDEALDPKALKAVAGLLDACVTCRMHFGIACLGSGTPIGVIPYQNKFEGLFDLFGISPPVLDSSQALSPGKLEILFAETLDRAAELRVAIEREIPRIMKLSSGTISAPAGILQSTGASEIHLEKVGVAASYRSSGGKVVESECGDASSGLRSP